MSAREATTNSRKMTVFRRVLLAIAGLFLGFTLYLANAQWTANEQLPMPFGVGMAVVLSGSMEPTLQVNDVVVVQQTDHITEGDIVVYQSGRGLIVHRVVSISGDTLVTRGDANNVDDKPISIEAVKGVVTTSIPALGGAVRALRSPAGVVVVLVVIVVLVELSYRSERRKDAEQNDELVREIALLREQLDASKAEPALAMAPTPEVQGVPGSSEALDEQMPLPIPVAPEQVAFETPAPEALAAPDENLPMAIPVDPELAEALAEAWSLPAAQQAAVPAPTQAPAQQTPAQQTPAQQTPAPAPQQGVPVLFDANQGAAPDMAPAPAEPLEASRSGRTVEP